MGKGSIEDNIKKEQIGKVGLEGKAIDLVPAIGIIPFTVATSRLRGHNLHLKRLQE